MPKEDKPLPYERRDIQDTKGIAQRIDLGYLGRYNVFRHLRRRITLIAPLVALAGVVPFFIKGTEKFFANGPVSRAHSVLENNCAACHTQSFSSVSDGSCKKCHDGPAHQATAVGEARCAECHIEHRGKLLLAQVEDRVCTRCHADLNGHGKNFRLSATSITAFRPKRHPEFSAAKKTDSRPLKLNHARHMAGPRPGEERLKFPKNCSECHATDLSSPKGDLLPVTFEQNCRTCHKDQLQFDVYQLLGDQAPPAPHTRDPKTIHSFIVQTYETFSLASPSIVSRPFIRLLESGQRVDFQASGPAEWRDALVKDSENYLFRQNKCQYCHGYERFVGDFPEVKKVNQIRGRYLPERPQGEPWFAHAGFGDRTDAEFSHRAHRAVECTSCHTTARKSTKTEDVLIPAMQSCLPCHGSTGTTQDNCAQCHLYHDKSKELDKDRRPIEQLTGFLRRIGAS